MVRIEDAISEHSTTITEHDNTGREPTDAKARTITVKRCISVRIWQLEHNELTRSQCSARSSLGVETASRAFPHANPISHQSRSEIMKLPMTRSAGACDKRRCSMRDGGGGHIDIPKHRAAPSGADRFRLDDD